MKHYEYEISQFTDNELSDEAKEELFKHLAECTKCRQELSDYMLLKQQSKKIIADNISTVAIRHSAGRIFYKAGFYIASAAALILIFILVNKTPEEIQIKDLPRITQTVMPENPETEIKQEPPVTTVKIDNIKNAITEDNYIQYISGIPGIKLSEDDKILHEYGNDL